MEETKPSFKWKKQSRKNQNDESPKASKEWKRHGNEEHMNMSVHTLLRSCGVWARRNQNAEVNEPHILASEELSRLWKPGYPTLVDYNQC